MIQKTPYFVPKDVLEDALNSITKADFRQVINRPIGNFFYDSWELLDQYKGTAWEIIYNSIPFQKGEARIIRLEGAQSYFSHSDIDDRWHLNLTCKNAYLINLDDEEMYKLHTDGFWYDFNAGFRHTAVNFGNRPRIQLVVRKLLSKSTNSNLVPVSIKPLIDDLEDARYEFDDRISPYLNKVNKLGSISNFSYSQSEVKLDMEPSYIQELKRLAGNIFEIKT